MLRRLLLLTCLLFTPALLAAEDGSPAARWSAVDVAPTKTSIYVGSVSLTMPRFTREGATFRTTYSARVRPFFLGSEKGTLTIDFTDAQLQELAEGKTVEFTGLGLRKDGAERKVTGRATPTDATTGKLKVRVTVAADLELIFNTTYQFVP